jgi:hypothetical protein
MQKLTKNHMKHMISRLKTRWFKESTEKIHGKSGLTGRGLEGEQLRPYQNLQRQICRGTG